MQSTLVNEQSNNGVADKASFVDNREHPVAEYELKVDPMAVETWEIIALQTAVMNNWLLVLSRYLHKGGRLVSPDLPSDPIDDLPKAELAKIRNSDAYKALERFGLSTLKQSVEVFSEQALAGF